MDRQHLEELLRSVHRGDTDVATALDVLRDFPTAQLGDATLDMHRSLRRGFPEVVLGEGKSSDQLRRIVGRFLEHRANVLVTRLEPERVQMLLETFPDAGGTAPRTANLVAFRQTEVPIRGRGPVAVITAGTSDVPVAEEAAFTAELMGNEVRRGYDIGVAGIHRLLGQRELLAEASVLIVVAGMEGALASVVGGLVSKPVIAVPTSIGYGASFGGIAALLGMLNSCSAGVTVVNIDNGFGAGYAAALMNRRTDEETSA